MRYIARGFASSHGGQPVTEIVVSEKARDTHEGLSRDYWWEFTPLPSLWDRLVARIPARPTPHSRAAGVVIVLVAFVLVLGLAGWIEGAL